MIRKLERGALAWPSSVLLALVLTAAPLRADAGGFGADSWSRAFGYAGCALGIAAATTGLGLTAAVVMCLRVFVAEA